MIRHDMYSTEIPIYFSMELMSFMHELLYLTKVIVNKSNIRDHVEKESLEARITKIRKEVDDS